MIEPMEIYLVLNYIQSISIRMQYALLEGEITAEEASTEIVSELISIFEGSYVAEELMESKVQSNVFH